MVLERDILPYWTWLLSGSNGELGVLPRFLITFLVIAILGLVGGFLIALIRYGPLKAGDLTYRVVTTGLFELTHISFRRIWALAMLAVRESLRRRVVVALGVFFLILLFAGWFMRTDYADPAKLYISFVLTATTYLVLLIALLLSAFSLPNDFKFKTIHTIVTKPVRAGDIILGRILGFTLVGTALLLVMAISSYVFVTRSLDHTHRVDLSSLEDIEGSDGTVIGKKGRTSLEQYHRHEVEIDSKGEGWALSQNGHEHEIRPAQGPSEELYEVSGPVNMFRARVPYYGRLRFLDRSGRPVAKGINVGNEWTYRSFIEGGSQGAAIWTFDNINASMLEKDDDGNAFLPIELTVRVFRTYMGNIERGIQGVIQLRNPDPENGLRSEPIVFTAKDLTIETFPFYKTLTDSNQQQIDLLTDLVDKDGKVEVWVQCLDRSQYYGFAQPDCYIRLPDTSPTLNFFKAYASIWVQMVLVISIGVACSTVLNGPVAMLFTMAFITLGFFREFFISIAQGTQVGGGPIESLVRLVTQKNLIVKLDDTYATRLIQAIDGVFETAMLSIAYLLPDFRSLSTVDFAASGFHIPGNLIMQDLTSLLAFVLGLFVAGYFLLRTREVAK